MFFVAALFLLIPSKTLAVPGRKCWGNDLQITSPIKNWSVSANILVMPFNVFPLSSTVTWIIIFLCFSSSLFSHLNKGQPGVQWSPAEVERTKERIWKILRSPNSFVKNTKVTAICRTQLSFSYYCFFKTANQNSIKLLAVRQKKCCISIFWVKKWRVNNVLQLNSRSFPWLVGRSPCHI